MDSSKKNATQAQLAALMEFMHDHAEFAKSQTTTGVIKEEVETLWENLTTTLNSMGGAIKSAEKWKRTWHDLKYANKKRALRKRNQSMCDTSSEYQENTQNYSGNNSQPPKKRYATFDEEIIRIEREKLELDREYKVQKIEALSRIATALEEIARKKS